MYPTPILWFEICVAVGIAIALLCTKPEYGLFLYAFVLGFPDLAYPAGSTINVRLDDVLIGLFLVRTLFWTPAPLSRTQRNISIWQALFFALCVFSLVIETASGVPPGGYEPVKMAGCAAVVLALPRIVQSHRRLRFLLSGLMCGGVALLVQIHQHLGDGSQGAYANFQQFKSAAAFSTWNPNTTGQAAILLDFAAGLGGVIFSKSPAGRFLWPSLAVGFALVPPLVFARGTSLSIAAAFVLFLCLMRRWKWILVFAAVCLCALAYLHSRDPQLLKDASAVNVLTGDGLSHRFDRWEMAFQGIENQPWFGQGFGQELPYLTRIGSVGRAHNAYLAVWLELGLGGLLVFLAAVYQFFRASSLLLKNPGSRAQGAMILSLAAALCLDSVGLPTLYWEKLPTIALSLALAVVGICERNGPALAQNKVRDFVEAPAAQFS
jgi:O-antigen ligase